jgi:hypothetical protein
VNADGRGWDKEISHKEAQKAQKGMRDQILPFVLLVPLCGYFFLLIRVYRRSSAADFLQ